MSDPATERTVLAVKKDDRFPLIGRTVGGIKLDSGISDGGMGVVYKGKLDGRDVAVKVLRDGFVNDENNRERFLGDVEISRRLNHPGVLEVLAHGNEDVPYFVTPFMPFTLDNANLLPNEGAQVILDIARVLMHAHKNNVIHRDIKPLNILLDESMRVKVCDWGIAKNVTSSPGPTMHGQIMGSHEYIAPEQVKDSSNATALSDLYSLAGTAFFVHSDSAPLEDRTTTVKGEKSSKLDLDTTLFNRQTRDKPYKIWLNDAIELRRAELSDSGKERIVRLSEEYEDLIMMVLNAKKPESRINFEMFVQKLEFLIATDDIVYKEPSNEETANQLQAYAELSEKVERTKLEVEQLPDADKVGLKNWVKPKLMLAKSLEQLANQTARTDDKRALYFDQALKLYSQIDLAIRMSPEQVEGLGDLDKVMSWLGYVISHEQARKVYLGAKKAERETRDAIEAASCAFASSDFEKVAQNYKRIDFSVLDLKEKVDDLTKAISKHVEELVSEGEKVVSAEFALAALKHDAAFKLSEVLPEAYADLKKRVASLDIQINNSEIKTFEAAYAAASSSGDYVKMYQASQDIEGRLKRMGKDAPEGAVKSFETHKAELKDKEMDISILLKIRESINGSVDRTVTGLENDFKKVVEIAKSLGDYPLSPEKIASYEASIEDKLAKMGSVNKDNVGPQYDSLSARISSLKEKVLLEKDMYLVSQGSFYERVQKAAELAARYAGKNPGMEIIFKGLLVRFVTDEISKSETKKL